MQKGHAPVRGRGMRGARTARERRARTAPPPPLGTVEPHRAHGRVRVGLALRRPSDSGAPARNADGACGHRHARREHLGAEHRPRPRANRPKCPSESRATLSDRMAAGGKRTDHGDDAGLRPDHVTNALVRAPRRGGTLTTRRQPDASSTRRAPGTRACMSSGGPAAGRRPVQGRSVGGLHLCAGSGRVRPASGAGQASALRLWMQSPRVLSSAFWRVAVSPVHIVV